MRAQEGLLVAAIATALLCCAVADGGDIAAPAGAGGRSVPVDGVDMVRLQEDGEEEESAPYHQLHHLAPQHHLPLLEAVGNLEDPSFNLAAGNSLVAAGNSLVAGGGKLPSHRLSKRNYPRWYQAYAYKTPTYGNWRASQMAERKRFLPFHPLARFRGLSMGSSTGSGGSIGRNALVGGRTAGLLPAMNEDNEGRWGGSGRGSITPFSDMLVADMPEHNYLMDQELRDSSSDYAASHSQEGQAGDKDAAIEEAFRHRLGSMLGKDSGARSRQRLTQAEQLEQESVLKAGELLQYLMAVNGDKNVGSSLRFGFTK